MEEGRSSEEAIRLGRSLVSRMPDEAERARTAGGSCSSTTREAQHAFEMASSSCSTTGPVAVGSAADRGRSGRAGTSARGVRRRGLQHPGSIAELHLSEPRDWEEIAILYRRFEQVTRSPVVTMNRAVAVAELQGPGLGLALLDGVELEDSAAPAPHEPICCDASPPRGAGTGIPASARVTRTGPENGLSSAVGRPFGRP